MSLPIKSHVIITQAQNDLLKSWFDHTEPSSWSTPKPHFEILQILAQPTIVNFQFLLIIPKIVIKQPVIKFNGHTSFVLV